jgi:hypothetical protein
MHEPHGTATLASRLSTMTFRAAAEKGLSIDFTVTNGFEC